MKGAVIDVSGRVIAQETMTTFVVRDDPLAGIRKLLCLLHGKSTKQGRRPAGIGLASPGLVDPETGTVVFAANLGWSSVRLREILEAEFGLPVRVDHDARAGAVAERAAHPVDHAGLRDFIFVPIGTGVAAAVVTSGVLVVGATGAAGEFGHIPATPGGDLCTCGQRGCIEAYASAGSILRRYLHHGGETATSTPEIAQSLTTDPVAAAVWGDAVEALALGISALTAVLDPATVIIGGGLSKAGEVLLEPLRNRVADRLSWRPSPTIIQSTLGSETGLIGAAILAWADQPLSDDFAVTARDGLAGGFRFEDRRMEPCPTYST